MLVVLLTVAVASWLLGHSRKLAQPPESRRWEPFRLTAIGRAAALGGPAAPGAAGNGTPAVQCHTFWPVPPDVSCEPASPAVRALRCQRWPLRKEQPAPRISRAVYINLRWDARRRDWMERQFDRLRRQGSRFAVERVAAVEADEVRANPRFEAVRQRGFNPTKYPNVEGLWGVAGCQLSHVAVLRKLREEAPALLARREVWLVLEDDAQLPDNLEAAWERLWPFVPEAWDVLRLGWFGGSTCRGRVNDRLDLALWSDPPPSGPCSYCGSHAYVVNPASVDKVLHRLERARTMHTDCLLGAPTPPLEEPGELPPLLAFAVRPPLSLQNEHFPSDRDTLDFVAKL